MDPSLIQDIPSGLRVPSVAEVKELEKLYPYWTVPAVAAFRGHEALPAEDEGYLRRRIGADVGDEAALESLLGSSPFDFNDFYPDQRKPDLDTADTIDAFLNKFGKSSPALSGSPAEDNLDALMTAGMDYASMMEAEALRKEEEEKASTPEEPEEMAVVEMEPAEEKPNLSESFAKVMVRKGNYRKALEILEKAKGEGSDLLYLDDQIRFLKKIVELTNPAANG